MKKSLFTLLLISLLVTGIAATCNAPITSTASPSATATPIITPTLTETPLPPTPEFAPACDVNASSTSLPASTQCQFPIAQAGSDFCEKKNPYNLVYLNPGASYDVLTYGFWCTDAGMKNDKHLLTCTGPMASDYQVIVCDPACAIPTVQADVTQCQQGYNYDASRGCCTQSPIEINQNCTVLNLQTTTCLVDCSIFKKKYDCNQNSIACKWDTETRSCKLRQ